jgi:hypothetical protein
LQAAKAAPPPQEEGGKTLTPGAEEGAVDNDAVIRMARSGLPDDIILKSINSAPRCNFDASPRGLVALAEAKVSPKLIERIQEIAAKGNAAPKAKPAPKKPAAGKKPGGR